MRNEAVVYVMACDHPGGTTVVKVGYAKDAYARLATLQGANPFPIRLVYVSLTGPLDAVRQIEAQTHQALAAHRLRGEWFAVEAERAIDTIEGFMRLDAKPARRGKPRLTLVPELIDGLTQDEWLEGYKRGPQPGDVIWFAPPLPGEIQ